MENMSSPSNSTDEGSDIGETAVQLTFFIILLLATFLGNGLLLFLFLRNKTILTVHHVLIVNLSTVDLLNSVIKHINLYLLRRFRHEQSSW